MENFDLHKGVFWNMNKVTGEYSQTHSLLSLSVPAFTPQSQSRMRVTQAWGLKSLKYLLPIPLLKVADLPVPNHHLLDLR